MSTKKDHKEQQERSLILELENALLALENHVGPDEIWAYVNMILKGFISNGRFTDEYIALAKQTLEMKASKEFENEFLQK